MAQLRARSWLCRSHVRGEFFCSNHCMGSFGLPLQAPGRTSMCVTALKRLVWMAAAVHVR
jgi:hypothetical protein